MTVGSGSACRVLLTKSEQLLHQASAIIELVRGGNYDIAQGAAGSRILDPYAYLVPTFSQCGDPPTPCGSNTTGYMNEEFDRLGLEFLRSQDLDRRIEIADRLRAILLEDVPAFPRDVLDPRLRGRA